MKSFAGSIAEMEGLDARERFPNYLRRFDEQVKEYQESARSSWKKAPASDRKLNSRRMAEFRELRELLEAEINDFSKEDFQSAFDTVERRTASITIFMYLFDKVVEMHNAVERKDRKGLYALFGSVREHMYAFLSTDFFEAPYHENVRVYIDLEPVFTACASLAGVELVPIHDAVRDYQPKLAKRIGPLTKKRKPKAEKAARTKSGKPKPAKKKARSKTRKKQMKSRKASRAKTKKKKRNRKNKRR